MRKLFVLLILFFVASCSNEADIINAENNSVIVEQQALNMANERDTRVVNEAMRLTKQIESLVNDRQLKNDEAILYQLSLEHQNNVKKNWIISGMVIAIIILIIAIIRRPVVIPEQNNNKIMAPQNNLALQHIRNDVFVLNGNRIQLPQNIVMMLLAELADKEKMI